MLNFFSKHKIRIMAGLALLAALLFYSLNLRQKETTNAFERAVLTVTAPVGGLVFRINNFFAGIWDNYISLVGVRRENDKLRDLVKQLNTRVIRNQEAVLATKRLQQLLDLRNALHVPSIAARVIGEDVTPWFRTVIVDRGSIDGVREGMPVVASAGVVGRVVRVASSSSRLLLLTDNASAIAATMQRSRARGVVKGKNGQRCILDFSQRGEDIKVGDVILTSGIGGVFPKSLPIGEVTMVKKGEYGIFQTVELRPFVSMSRLEEVLILLR
ncbi:MAG TPA: rod shape-determining protein MreC [Geobacteraceae bacterium]|nr:rod shape-determining protein MreC [Geobacteraceae bacterium]